MYSRILVPTDGSPHSLEILPTLRCLGGGANSPELLLLQVEDPETGEGEDLAQAVSKAKGRLEEWGFSISAHHERGDPAAKILECSEQLDVDLVAMSSHGRSGLERMIRGSVAERVLRRCPVPLLLRTPRTHQVSDYTTFSRILVPLDGSPLAEQILADVEILALACDSEVTLLRVESPLQQPPARFDEPKWWSEEQIEAELAPLNPQRDALLKAGVRVRRQVAYGFPTTQILEAARKTDLIAMTTHGRSGASRWLFGSVAEAVLREVGCPLLIRRIPPA